MAKVKRVKATGRDAIAVAGRLHSAAIHLLRYVRMQDSATRIGPAQLSALSVLVFAGPKTLGGLADAEQVKPPTMSRIVAGLKRSGLITTTPDSADARRMHIAPTPAGIRLLQKARLRRIESLAALLNGLSPADLSGLDESTLTLEQLLRPARK